MSRDAVDPVLHASDRFDVVRRLGEGGMGIVYEVDDRALGRRCALKLLKRDGVLDFVRFKREFRLVASFHHPNLVRLFDLQQLPDGRACYTMDLVDGVSLKRALHAHDVAFDPSSVPSVSSTRGASTGVATVRVDATTDPRDASFVPEAPPAPREPRPMRPPACDVAALGPLLGQMLDALEFLHENGIVHRDLKPDNVLVDRDGRVRLLDFGIVERVTHEDAIDAGTFRGTLPYMAPELIKGARATPPADLYALGCMLHELVAGHLPYVGTDGEIVHAHHLAPPPRLDTFVDGLPAGLSDVTTALLAKAPHERPTIDDIRARLGLARRGARRPTASSLVGRDAELALLREKMGAALAGRPQLVLLEGESGIGKSALAEVFCREADCLVLTGRCYERESLPFRALDSCMDELALHLRAWSPTDLAPLMDDVARASLVFAAFGVLLPKERRSTGAAEMSRADVFASLRRIVRAAQAQRPVLFLIDDLQWTDAESVELIKALLAPPRTGRFLIVGLSRPVSDRAHPSWSLRELPQATHVPVRPLDDAAMQRVLEMLVGPRGPGAYDAIIARSRGNPFFVQQVALALRSHPELASSSALPSLPELVRLRCGELSPDALAVVETATVLGTIASRRTLASADVAGSFQAALDEALTSGLMSIAFAPDAAAGHRLAYDLSHDAIRENVYADLSAARRRGLHTRLLTALEEDPDATADAKLRHAQAVGDSMRIHRYASQAATQAHRRFSYEHASDLYAVAIRFAPADLDVAARAELHLGLSEARHLMNDYPTVKAHMHAALALLGVPAPTGRVRQAWSTARLALRHAARRLGRADSMAPVSNVAVRLRAATALERLVEIHAVDSDPASAFHALFQMVDLCETLPPSPELARALVALSVGLKMLGLRALATDYRARAERLVAHSDDALALATVTLHGAFLDVSEGQWAAAHARMKAARALFERVGSDERVLHVMALDLHLWAIQGHHDDAQQNATALEAEAARVSDRVRTATSHLVRAELAARAGDVDVANQHLSSLPDGDSHGVLEALRLSVTALVRAREQRRDATVDAVDAALRAIGGPVGPPFLGTPLALLAEATRALADDHPPARRRARDLHRRLRMFSWSHPFMTATCLIQEAALARDPSRARRALVAAVASAETYGLLYERGRALEAMARLDPGDAALARRAADALALSGVPATRR